MARPKKPQIDKTIDKQRQSIPVDASFIDPITINVSPKELVLKAAEMLTVKGTPKSWLVTQLESLAEKIKD